MKPALQTSTAVADFFDRFVQRFGYLHDRWQDEHQYEDFADYETHVRLHLPEGFTFVRLTKRPFALTFTQGGGTYKATASARRATLRRLK